MNETIYTLDEALDVYFDAYEDESVQPSRALSDYDEKLGGWVLCNIRGVCALVKDDGTIIEPVWDQTTAEWVLP